MTFLEFLDRWGERRSRRDPLLHLDAKTLIGAGFIFGYYALVFAFMRSDIPAASLPLVRDSMLVLGPPVGAIVNSIFRESSSDVVARASSGAALRTLAANAGTGDGTTADTTGAPKA
jgi:hypothetical protein